MYMIIYIFLYIILSNHIFIHSFQLNMSTKSIAIPFSVYIKNGTRQFVRCSLCKFYDKNTMECNLFATDALHSRTNNQLCGYSAKYFEPEDILSKLKKMKNNIITKIIHFIHFLLHFNHNIII